MPRDELPQLLSRRNREEAIDLGIKLDLEEAGGAVLYGCALSGRYELAQLAAHELQPRREYWVTLNVSLSPREEDAFLRQLAQRFLERVKDEAPPTVVERLNACASLTAPFKLRDMLRDALRELRPVVQTLLFFRNLDAVETTHRELESCFEALRDILLEGRIHCFVTSYEDLRGSITGVSHFANNFTCVQTHPVTQEEVAVAWGSGKWLAPEEAASRILQEYGFAEIRVQKALGQLQRSGSLSPGDWAQRLKERAQADHIREAEKFWEKLDQTSRSVLRNSLLGQESPREHVDLILSHKLSRYSLRLLSEDRVEIFDAPLRAHVQQELIKHRAGKVSGQTEQPLERVVKLIREGDPAVALELLSKLEEPPSLSESQRKGVRRLRSITQALEGAINGNYAQAITRLETLGDALDAESQELLAFWRTVVGTQDLSKFWDKGTKTDILRRLALELARAHRRERLQRWPDAFKDFMVVVESATQALLAQRGLTKKSPLPSWHVPEDALSQYHQDLKHCGRTEQPSALPFERHGGLEALWLCRALNLADLRALRMKDVNESFQLRTKVNHNPALVEEEEVVRARELALQVMHNIASSWNLPIPDGNTLLWPEQLVAAQLNL
jgi:plasmid stabilization system protein ParE